MDMTQTPHQPVRTVILLAGLWLDHGVWQPVLEPLRDAGLDPVPVALPGQDDDRDATLDDQLAAVLQAVDRASGPVLLVGHSAACTLAWLAADRRPQRVARVALVGGFPEDDGGRYAPFFEPQDGRMAFPGWEAFAGPDSDDLADEQKQELSAMMRPVPVGVSHAEVHYTTPDRRRTPVALLCPEYSPQDARAWIDAGDVPELARAEQVSYVDLASGHWPMASAPQALARELVRLARGGADQVS